MSRTPDPQLSFADLEELEPDWASISTPSCNALAHSSISTPIWSSKSAWIWSAALKNPQHRAQRYHPLTQTLRSLTLMRIKNWDYRELRERYQRRLHAARLLRSC